MGIQDLGNKFSQIPCQQVIENKQSALSAM